ncbi:hypothetical protein BKA69DRAFT_1127658 [Paraphysoderma sedebokerense]|nr:hypothetical protein BKA69DRAFT_1127658 [Paraphysoderma sedebokerense]
MSSRISSLYSSLRPKFTSPSRLFSLRITTRRRAQVIPLTQLSKSYHTDPQVAHVDNPSPNTAVGNGVNGRGSNLDLNLDRNHEAMRNGGAKVEPVPNDNDESVGGDCHELKLGEVQREREVTIDELMEMLQGRDGKEPIYIDIKAPNELSIEGTIERCYHLPAHQLFSALSSDPEVFFDRVDLREHSNGLHLTVYEGSDEYGALQGRFLSEIKARGGVRSKHFPKIGIEQEWIGEEWNVLDDGLNETTHERGEQRVGT